MDNGKKHSARFVGIYKQVFDTKESGTTLDDCFYPNGNIHQLSWQQHHMRAFGLQPCTSRGWRVPNVLHNPSSEQTKAHALQSQP
jgi:hypothetical protein